MATHVNVQFIQILQKGSTGQPFFRHGLPALVAFSPNCRSSRCYTRYDGDLSVDAIVDWIATSILGLPRILYYSRKHWYSKP
ncbi:unnamed protein product [Spirodela intermedia]|uniref:Uncharacterized protein n=1 Tax=Spirodela intermedia TaxID=51605 RepID=A0A7I8IPK5_SPIIN|nr:unnamed protein product [Spirodela intermedia]CAA6659730.1 unnamed protein product [Spirodela intermedia]